jgi:hypothetical protein
MLKRSSSPGSSARLQSRLRRPLQTTGLLLLLCSTFGWVRSSHAQAIATADKTGHVNVFGAYTLTFPDFSNQKDNGFTVGGDYMLRRFIFGQPAIAARYTRTTGPIMNESFAGGGLESYYKVGRVRPYATVLYGVGGLNSNFRGSHYSDSGNELLIGGGAELPFRRRFSARAEYTYGFLHVSGRNGADFGELNLTPSNITLGVVYHIR